MFLAYFYFQKPFKSCQLLFEIKWLCATPVVLHAGLNDQSRRMKLNKTMKQQTKTEHNDSFFEVKRKHDNPLTCFHCAHVNKCVICTISEKHRLASHPAAKHKLKVSHIREKNQGFFVINVGVAFVPARTLLVQVLLQKFLFL